MFSYHPICPKRLWRNFDTNLTQIVWSDEYGFVGDMLPELWIETISESAKMFLFVLYGLSSSLSTNFNLSKSVQNDFCDHEMSLRGGEQALLFAYSAPYCRSKIIKGKNQFSQYFRNHTISSKSHYTDIWNALRRREVTFFTFSLGNVYIERRQAINFINSSCWPSGFETRENQSI